MLRFLFPRLTTQPASGAALFDALTREARQRHWYIEGGVADTVDGRFAVLATVTALALVRLDANQSAAVALTERFAAVMETEHREIGLGDPALGRKVRKLVSAVGRRVQLWRSAVTTNNWGDAAAESLEVPANPRNAAALQQLWSRLQATPDEALGEGRIG